ncbi:hypothetical protein B0H13DRAFT_2319177 [Mycena leptocephala]|nr:hypothetical protein B0H13DRAFT_2319177 [Mycena leptocephala]
MSLRTVVQTTYTANTNRLRVGVGLVNTAKLTLLFAASSFPPPFPLFPFSPHPIPFSHPPFLSSLTPFTLPDPCLQHTSQIQHTPAAVGDL